MLKKIAGVVVSVAPLSAFAAAPDFTTLTAAVDWSTAIAAILLVMAGLAGVFIVSGGGSMILDKIRRKGS